MYAYVNVCVRACVRSCSASTHVILYFTEISKMMQPEEEVLWLCKNGHNVLITGQAGTGKTTLLKKVHATCASQGRIVAVTASTGIATTQFHDGAMTLHSWAGLKVSILNTVLLHCSIIIMNNDTMHVLNGYFF